MVLSAIEAAPRGCLSKLVAFFTATFSLIYPGDQVIGISRMAISTKLSGTNWMFFRGVYNKLLKCHINSLKPDERLFFSRFKDCFAADGSIIRLNKTLEKVFESTCKSQAALKLNVKFSLVNLAVTKLQVTEGKRHDSRFRFMKELDMRVQLAKSKQSQLKTELRLVGILHEEEWRFYVTNIFDALFTPQVIYELYSKRWTIETFTSFFLTQLSDLIRGTKTKLIEFFRKVVSAIACNCLKPPPRAA